MFSQRRINFSACFLKGKNTTLAPSAKLFRVCSICLQQLWVGGRVRKLKMHKSFSSLLT